MSNSAREGLRERVEPAEKAPLPAREVSVDNVLQPDYVLVFSEKSKPDVLKSTETLSDAGFFVTSRKGASSTVLLLVRAGPGIVAGSKNRSLTVEERLAWLKLPGVIDKFPPYNPSEVKVTARNGGIWSLKPAISAAQLDNIESLAGTDPAAAFEFEGHMLVAFLAVAINGIQSYYQHSVVDMYTMLAIATFFVSLWTQKDKQKRSLASDVPAAILPKREGFRGTTGQKRELIRLLFIPFATLLMIFYAAGLLGVLGIEVFCTQLYDGPLKPVVGLIPVGANVVASQIFSIIYTFFVNKFVEWEDYPTEETLTDAKNQRQFYLQALLAYMPVVFSAYLYLPFGNHIGYFLPKLHESKVSQYVSLVQEFKLQKNRLATQAQFFAVTQPIINVLMGTLMPVGLYAFKRYVLKQADGAGNSRFAVEQLLVPFDSNAEIQLVILSFGYILIISPIWPLASVAITAAFYIRTAIRLFILSSGGFRKPVSCRNYRGIGFWNDELQIVLLICAVVAPTIDFMYGRKSSGVFDAKTAVQTWPSVIAIAFFCENGVLILYHVLSKFWGLSDSLSVDNHLLKRQIPQSALQELQSEQDALWSRQNMPIPDNAPSVTRAD